jgi:hypothetical protein
VIISELLLITSVVNFIKNFNPKSQLHRFVRHQKFVQKTRAKNVDEIDP